MMEGGCPCGAARYRMTAAPIFVNCCHCRDCQQQSGTAFALNAIVETDRVELLSGTVEGTEVPAPSGKPQIIVRCASCKGALWSHYRGIAALRFVRAGTLDDPTQLTPGAHIFVRSKLPWIALDGTLPAFETRYDRDTLWPADSLARFKAALGLAT